MNLPVHYLDKDSLQINILPLDHTNPYDFKREHRHSYYEIILIRQGGCNQLIDFINYPGLNHSCYIICPQQVHLMNRNAASGTVVQFTEERINSKELINFLKHVSWQSDASIIFEDRPDIFEDCMLLLDLLSKQLCKDNMTTNYVATNLLHAFVSLIVSQINFSAYEPKLEGNILHDFYRLLEDHFLKKNGVQFYLESLGVHEKKLAQLTKKHLGLSPLQVIHNRIILEAKRLLLFGEISHKEIAYHLGFDSPASFSAFIKSKTGLTPTEMEKQLAEIHK